MNSNKEIVLNFILSGIDILRNFNLENSIKIGMQEV